MSAKKFKVNVPKAICRSQITNFNDMSMESEEENNNLDQQGVEENILDCQQQSSFNDLDEDLDMVDDIENDQQKMDVENIKSSHKQSSENQTSSKKQVSILSNSLKKTSQALYSSQQKNQSNSEFRNKNQNQKEISKSTKFFSNGKSLRFSQSLSSSQQLSMSQSRYKDELVPENFSEITNDNLEAISEFHEQLEMLSENNMENTSQYRKTQKRLREQDFSVSRRIALQNLYDIEQNNLASLSNCVFMKQKYHILYFILDVDYLRQKEILTLNSDSEYLAIATLGQDNIFLSTTNKDLYHYKINGTNLKKISHITNFSSPITVIKPIEQVDFYKNKEILILGDGRQLFLYNIKKQKIKKNKLFDLTLHENTEQIYMNNNQQLNTESDEDYIETEQQAQISQVKLANDSNTLAIVVEQTVFFISLIPGEKGSLLAKRNFKKKIEFLEFNTHCSKAFLVNEQGSNRVKQYYLNHNNCLKQISELYFEGQLVNILTNQVTKEFVLVRKKFSKKEEEQIYFDIFDNKKNKMVLKDQLKNNHIYPLEGFIFDKSDSLLFAFSPDYIRTFKYYNQKETEMIREDMANTFL
ncbi:WD40-repeat-containing domain [Pseudocohnilembus persalinus]|uniref:WD40-repeat-containing domain n=1 Tax=Pseudocohnilembus persalinus TaxID=266149 RepID=A0A0V0QQT0_PSEPJ|nr:WD40-repeat-containing domain [Pseudocohnilembus persalinus]|eukprot:KRX04394.1 WD40-repeat-containing domain [Pseudocohnilembus persalinus]